MHNNISMNSYQIQGVHQPMGDDIKRICKKYMDYHVIGEMKDGSQIDGIITGMDEESVIMLVPEEIDGGQENRQQFGYGYDDYGRPRRRYRRYRRRRYPYFYFAFPYFRPYPYYYPY